MARKYSYDFRLLVNKFGYNAADALNYLLDSPVRLLRFLLHDVSRPIVDDRHRLPEVDGNTVDPLPTISSVGLTVYGKWWAFGKYITPQKNSRLIIHWPTIIAGAADRFHTAPSAALMVMAMSSHIRRKSPVVCDLLMRTLKVQYLERARTILETYTIFDEDNKDLQPLSEDEMLLLRARLGVISTDTKLIRAIRHSFIKTFGDVANGDSNPKLKELLPALPREDRFNCSLLFCDRITHSYAPSVATVVKMPKSTTTESYDSSFFAAHYKNILSELFYILEFCQYQWGGAAGYAKFRHKYGVGIRKDLDHRFVDRYLYIHWPTWLEHRLQYSRDIFKCLPLEPVDKTALKNGGLPEPRRTYLHIHEVLNTSYFRGMVGVPHRTIGSWDVEMKKHYSNIFNLHAPPKPYEYCVLDIPSLLDALLLSRVRQEQARVRRPGRRNDGRPKGCRPFDILKVPYTSVSLQEEFQFIFTHRRGSIYISPPWSQALDTEKKFPDKTVGIVRDGTTDTRYYTLAFLKEHAAFGRYHPLHDEIQTVWRFLEVYESLELHAFNNWRRDTLNLPNSRWSSEQRQAIAALYHPSATGSMQASLQSICANRSRASMANMASTIRREMMSRGIFDLDKLPYKLLTEKLSREVWDAKRLWELAQEKDKCSVKKVE